MAKEEEKHADHAAKPQQSILKNKWVQSIGVIVLALILAGGFIYLQESRSEVGIDTSLISAPSIDLSPSAGGVLQQTYVNEGDTVPANTAVALIGTELVKTKVAGTITNVQDNVGASFTPGEPVVTMVDPTELRVVGTIDENKGLSRISVGQPATFTVDAFGSKQYQGIVDEISPTANSSDVVFNISDERETQQFNVKVRFDPSAYPELKRDVCKAHYFYKVGMAEAAATAEVAPPVAPTQAEESSNLKWWVLLTVIIGTFLGRLDQTIVNLALPKIIESFSISVSAAGWIATAYILANAIFVPIWGKLGDTIGRKKVYIIGFSVFIFGSALAGLAWNLSSMIVFRVIQSIAGSADYPTAMAILAVTFTGTKERAQALGIWSSSFAAAAVFGPLIGGPLIDSFGWRSVFLVNIPVGIVGLFMAITFVRESVAEKATTHFDWWGAITLGIALSSLVLVLDQGTTWGWTALYSVLCYVATVAFTWIFITIEHHSPEPIVDLRFFKIPAFVNTLWNNFIVFMGLTGCIFLVPIFAQTFLGYTATQSGYLFIPLAAALMLAAPIGGLLIGRVKPGYVIAASTLVAGLGIYMFSFLIDPRSTALDIMVPLAVMAFGLGFGMAQRTNIVAQVVEQDEIGVASSILALVRNIAGAFGIAVFATILNNVTNANVLNLGRGSVLQNSANPADYQKFIALIILKAEVSAYGEVFVIAAALVLVGAVTALWIRVGHEKGNVHVMVE